MPICVQSVKGIRIHMATCVFWGMSDMRHYNLWENDMGPGDMRT